MSGSHETAEPANCFEAVEEVDVRMTISPQWAHRGVPWGLAGNIAWRFSMAESGPLIGLNSSRLEIYAYKPEFNDLLVGGTVPVTFLRRLVMPLTWSFREHHFCSTVFYDLALKDDVKNGAPAFTDMPAGNNFAVSFRLNEFLSGLAEAPKQVNCYDQACIMMAVLALVHPIDSLA